jgi:hypothetical protein
MQRIINPEEQPEELDGEEGADQCMAERAIREVQQPARAKRVKIDNAKQHAGTVAEGREDATQHPGTHGLQRPQSRYGLPA